MFTQVGTFVTGWVYDPVTGIASSFGGWFAEWFRALFA